MQNICQDCEFFAGEAIGSPRSEKSQFGRSTAEILPLCKLDRNKPTMAKTPAAAPAPSGKININIIDVEVCPHEMVVPRGSIEGFDKQKWKACGKFDAFHVLINIIICCLIDAFS